MTNHTDTEKKKGSFLKELLQWAAAIALAAAVAIIADNFLIVNAQIPSGSMEDTIMPGDRIIGNRLSYTFSDPQRFDVIIFRYPDDESQLFIKRIIGLPGETVEIIEGRNPQQGLSVPTKFRRTVILSWVTIGTIPWTPASGRILLSAGMRYSGRLFSDTGRSPRSN